MPDRALVLYHYFEKDASYIDNFFHFLAFGYSATLDYLVIVAGPCSVALPQLPNVRYLHTENRNNDFGGYALALQTAVDPLAHDYFFFVNASVRGPYLAAYNGRCWSSYFIDLLAADASVGLVGPTISILSPQSPVSHAYECKYGGTAPYAHVQSMCYAMPRASLQFLLASGFFASQPALSKDDVIRDYEVRLTQTILARGWNIKCLCAEYNLTDYRRPCSDVNPTSQNGDANSAYGYFGRTAHPLEIMFVKVNRDLYLADYLDRLSYSLLRQRPVPAAVLLHPWFAVYAGRLALAGHSREKIGFTFRRQWQVALIPKFLRAGATRLFPSLAKSAPL